MAGRKVRSELPVVAGIDVAGSRVNVHLAEQPYFVHDKSMNVDAFEDGAVSRVAAAIAEPARTRMLYCLMDGHARTSTELAIVGEVTPSTASAHLNRLKAESLVKVHVQGRHRYYSLEGPDVARALEGLSMLACGTKKKFVPNAPSRLRMARSCYDHMAGAAAVLVHDRFLAMRWIRVVSLEQSNSYELTMGGAKAFQSLGVAFDAARSFRRRLAYGCLDWSERRPHLGGALGSELLKLLITRKWFSRELDSRELSITPLGRVEMRNRFGIEL